MKPGQPSPTCPRWRRQLSRSPCRFKSKARPAFLAVRLPIIFVVSRKWLSMESEQGYGDSLHSVERI